MIKRVTCVHKVDNIPDDIPQWLVTFTDGTKAFTDPRTTFDLPMDHSFTYLRAGQQVDVEFNAEGRITALNTRVRG